MILSNSLLVTILSIASLQAFAAEPIWLDPPIQSFINTLNAGGGKPIEQLAPKDARQVLIGAQAGAKTDLSGISVTEKSVTSDGLKISLTIVKPAGVKKKLPAFMFFHGGGWVLGDFKTHERFVRDLVVLSGTAAVFVNYSPSPEVKYPVAINEAYAATKWVSEHGHEINIDRAQLAVAGNSVGGNMSTVVAMMAKEKGMPKLKLQVLFWPVTDATFETESYNRFSSGYFLTKNMMKWFWDNYTVDPKQRAEIHASPLRATADELRGLPPTLVQTAENDVLRDEGEMYARHLAEAGVFVTSTRYNGMIQDYGLLNAIATDPGVKSALLQAAGELKKYLNP